MMSVPNRSKRIRSADYKKGYMSGYRSGQRGCKPSICTPFEPNSDESKQDPNYPWSVNGFWNGDMFEDWLTGELSPGDPYYKLHRFLRLRERAIYRQAIDSVCESMNIVKNRLNKGE